MFRLGGWERNQPSKSQAAQCGTDPWSSGWSGEGRQASLAAGKVLYTLLCSPEDTGKSLSGSEAEKTYYYFYLVWGEDWELDVSMLHGRQGRAACWALLQGLSRFLMLSALPGGQCWALVALVRFHCLEVGQAADSTGCMLLAGRYSGTCSCQLVYWDSKTKARCWLPRWDLEVLLVSAGPWSSSVG